MVCITWAPWTAPRLARSSGYGAGVVAPGWCAHLWNTRGRADGTVIWLARIVHAMREEGHFVSVASAIEAQRLAVALAALRGRPRPGFAELADAVNSCLCEGQRTRWDSMAATVLVGADGVAAQAWCQRDRPTGPDRYGQLGLSSGHGRAGGSTGHSRFCLHTRPVSRHDGSSPAARGHGRLGCRSLHQGSCP
uniref:DUF5682 family protein n=1 Tax=Komagataeibacter piraceti TaxID=3229897 RepID=UPI003B5C900B